MTLQLIFDVVTEVLIFVLIALIKSNTNLTFKVRTEQADMRKRMSEKSKGLGELLNNIHEKNKEMEKLIHLLVDDKNVVKD